MITINVNLGKNSYPIYIEEDLLTRIPEFLRDTYIGKRIMIISDDNVFPLYGSKLEQALGEFALCRHLVLPHGEATKNFQSLPHIYDALLAEKFSRSDLIIALGGGVIGDLAGFAASSFLRGIPFIQVPTSLLAQVDSSVGGKVAVDLPQGKNLVGAFYQPKAVFIDPLVLHTLPEYFLQDGMGEVIKYGCIKDAALFEKLASIPDYPALLEQIHEIIATCVNIKRRVVEEDPFDKGERMLLNFGHTLAHTIEQYFHYQRESHGKAVAIGMYQISRLAEEQQLTETGTSEKILQLLRQYQLPDSCGLPLTELTGAIALDKKNLDKKLNLVLLHTIGDSYIYQSDPSFFAKEGRII